MESFSFSFDQQMNRQIILHKIAKSSTETDLLDALQLQTSNLPPLKPGKVRVQIHYASLNFADVLVVQGKYQERPTLPASLGSECSGVIYEIHESITSKSIPSSTSNNTMKSIIQHDLKLGQHVLVVCTTNTGAGAFADFIDVYPNQVFPIPSPMMNLPIAAGFAVAAGTAHIALVDRANIKAGETVVITGASGGTGMYACLIAKALGCRVVATARGEEKVKFVKSLVGADDVVINLKYKNDKSSNQSQPYQELIRAVLQINKMGAQVIYDTVGGGGLLFKTLLKCAKWKCRLCIVGFASGNIPKVPTNILLVKNSSVVGVYWGNYFKNEPETVVKSLFELFHLVESKRLPLHNIPTSQFQWDLKDLAVALSALAHGKTHGKVLIKCFDKGVKSETQILSKL